MIMETLLMLSALLFTVGLVVVITRRNIIMVLIGIELMFNAANLNFVAFSKFDESLIQGQMMTLFVIIIAACEAAVALAIVIQTVKLYKTSNLDDLNELKG